MHANRSQEIPDSMTEQPRDLQGADVIDFVDRSADTSDQMCNVISPTTPSCMRIDLHETDSLPAGSSYNMVNTKHRKRFWNELDCTPRQDSPHIGSATVATAESLTPPTFNLTSYEERSRISHMVEIDKLSRLLGQVEVENVKLKQMLTATKVEHEDVKKEFDNKLEKEAREVTKLKQEMDLQTTKHANLKEMASYMQQYLQSVPTRRTHEKMLADIAKLKENHDLLKLRTKNQERWLQESEERYRSKSSAVKNGEQELRMMEKRLEDLEERLSEEAKHPERVVSLRNQNMDLTKENETLKRILHKKDELKQEKEASWARRDAELLQRLHVEESTQQGLCRTIQEKDSEIQTLKTNMKTLQREMHEYLEKNINLEEQLSRSIHRKEECLHQGEMLESVADSLRLLDCVVETCGVIAGGGDPDTSILLGTRAHNTLSENFENMCEEDQLKICERLADKVRGLREKVSDLYASQVAEKVQCAIQ